MALPAQPVCMVGRKIAAARPRRVRKKYFE
jgi:hypothetical protein